MSNPTRPRASRTTGLLAAATAVMLIQQGLAYLGSLSIPVAAPRITEDLGISPALTGAYMAILNGTAVVSAAYGSNFIPRLGALRVSQLCLLLVGIGIAFAATGQVVLIAACAVLIGAGTAPSTPASSHLLARYSPPHLAPLIFSIKQTGVPVGGVIAGLLIPLLILQLGWQGALLTVAGITVAFGLLIQPLRPEFDNDRQTTHSTKMASLRAVFLVVARSPALRDLALSSAAFVGLQSVFGAFFVLYLVRDVGLSLTAGGTIFAIAQATAIVSRIGAGWIADRHIPTRAVLGWMGVIMAVAAAAATLFTADWPLVGLGVVAVAFASSAFGWNGVCWAEVARVAPSGQVGTVTGVLISAVFAAAMVYPAIFGLILGLTGRYDIGYIAAATPALIAGLYLLIHRRAGAPS